MVDVALRNYGEQLCFDKNIPFKTMYDKQIMQESGWEHYRADGSIITSSGGAKGVAQIVPTSHPKANWQDPYASLDYSTDLMLAHYVKDMEWKRALASYNWGPGNVRGYFNAEGVHPRWDGTRAWQCPVQGRYCRTGQMHHYLDIILGSAWLEPKLTTPAPTPIPMPTEPPMPTYNVGTGVLEKMTSLGDTPASDEVYFGDNEETKHSFTLGQSRKQYIYTFLHNMTIVLPDSSPVGQLPAPPTGDPWNKVRLLVADAGWSTPAEWGIAPPRPILSVVVHDLEGSTEGAINWWNTNKQSSAHIIISKNGDIVLCVRIEDIAWHGGTHQGNGRTPFWKSHNINPNSIGVELEGFTTQHYTDAQYDGLIKVGRWAKQKYGIQPVHTFDQIAGWHLHSDLSTDRSDPGPLFDFGRVLNAIG